MPPYRRRLGSRLALVVCGFAGAASGQAPGEPRTFGERIDVRTGFVRFTLPAGAPPPNLESIEVLWKGAPQRPVRLLGGETSPIELAIAVDRSASMHAALEPMRAAALGLVDRALSEDDRLFAVAFTEEPRFLAESRGHAANVIAALPTEPEAGNGPTALFESLTRTLQLFENADARAALLVVSHGCDTASRLASAESVARQAHAASIAIFLVMPRRSDCEFTTCQADASGSWACMPGVAPPASANLSDDMIGPIGNLGESARVSAATAARERFAGLVRRSGGGDYVARDAEGWQRALAKMFERLGRQWTVVFEPTSEEVRSDEIRVYSTAGGRRRRLE